MTAPPTAALVVAALVLGAGTYAFRLAGPLLRARITLGDRPHALMDTSAVVLLTALVATAALLEGHSPAGVARPTGVLVAGVLAWRRVPFVIVVVVAAAVAAGLRLLHVP
jgi:branched-subunit amino acid transport protein